MSFDNILAQVLDLLYRQGRVSFAAIKRRFEIDDAFVQDLKEEILYIHEATVQSDERGFTWTGTREDGQLTPQPLEPPYSQPIIAQSPTIQETISRDQPLRPAAERRQLTVMFCDLVDSTALSSRLDPEDLREVVRAYQSSCTEVIQRFEGHVAQLLGDGLLVYFGYPQAHEDDAERAVRAGLGMLAALDNLNARLAPQHDVALAVRIGIHTGLVVVGEMGEEGRHEQLALGETPNVAARLQGLAEPNTVVMSAATSELVEGYFEYQGLGDHTLRGVPEPIAVYHVLRQSGAQHRLDIAPSLTPLVGRELEVFLLLERWNQVQDGLGQVVLISGEAGIGKSRLVQMVKSQIAEASHTLLECRSSPYYQNTALYPITDLLHRVLQWRQEDDAEVKLRKLEAALECYHLGLEETAPLFANLLSLPLPEDRYRPLQLSPQRQRLRTLEALIALLVEASKHQPVFLVIEDLHWTDPTTLELLDLLIDQSAMVPMLILLTCRPDFQSPWHNRSYLSQVTLHRLSKNHIEEMVAWLTHDTPLRPGVIQELVEKTDGVPLFVEEMTRAILAAGGLDELSDRNEVNGALAALPVPNTLQDALMARLDRLGPSKTVAQLGSIIGREFSFALLQAISSLDELALWRALEQLVKAEVLYQRGTPPQATYQFKHALLQDMAYNASLRSTRQQYHEQIANTLESQFPGIVANQPELLAHHYTEARCPEPSITYWQKAGQRASANSALVEAINYFKKGLALLPELPDTAERTQHDFTLNAALGNTLIMSKWYTNTEVQQVLARAYTLSQRIDDSPQLWTFLRDLHNVYINRADYQSEACKVGEQMYRHAQRTQDPRQLRDMHHALAFEADNQGQWALCLDHAHQALAIHDTGSLPPESSRSHAYTLIKATKALWHLGYPDQAQNRCQEAVALARQLGHIHTIAGVLNGAGWFYLYLRKWHQILSHAEQQIAIAEEQGFPQWLVGGVFRRGFSLHMLGKREEGLAIMEQAVEVHRGRGTGLARQLHDAKLAEAYGNVGRTEEGLCLMTEALDFVNTTGLRYLEAELHCIRGELLPRQSPPDEGQSETCFQRALDVARQQQSKSYELRAAMSLARLWHHQGKRQDARDLLAPVYNWFTEGFNTSDLLDARALLDELE